MSAAPDASLSAQVEAVLDRRARSHDKPSDADLRPVFDFLRPTFPASLNAPSSSHSPARPPNTHWFCSKTPKPRVREAATFLIFLFAFHQAGTSKEWVDALEGVLEGCERCARAFGAARRRFSTKYLSNFPPQVRANFFSAVDKWEAALIVSEHDKASRTAYGSSTVQSSGLLDLSTSVQQLLLGEPSLLSYPGVAALVDTAVSSSANASTAASLGLTPVLVTLFTSADTARRQWATTMIFACSRRPLPFDEWCENGIGVEVQNFYLGAGDLAPQERWSIMENLLKSGCLSLETIQKGLLEGQVEVGTGRRAGKSVMSVLSGMLGGASDHFPTLLDCFSTLLRLSPTDDIWAFDTSPDLPHTLFSEIKNNASFQSLLESQNAPTTTETPSSLAKGKSKNEREDGLSWITPFLTSLIGGVAGVEGADSSGGGGFGEALAKVMNFCFLEMQHTRLGGELRAAAANAGFEALAALQPLVDRDHPSLSLHMSDTMGIHATFITTVALRRVEYPDPIWTEARSASRGLLRQIFRADGKDVVESMLGMAVIATTERRRTRKMKAGKAVPPPVPVTRLHLASVRRELWKMTYDTLSSSDVDGVAVLIRSIASFAHIEKLDRHGSWSSKDLTEVITDEKWTSGIRAINNALQVSRENFPRIMESLALQPDISLLRGLWALEGVPKAAVILLLSPAEEIHIPVISLIQQSFDDVDDRGDCFRVLLEKYPSQAMDGLQDFLHSFILTAQQTPESCSLAKWLVRCFTDVLDALCQPSRSSDALLQSEEFLSAYDGTSMARRVAELWQLMTTGLAVIFKRTQDWAPYFENSVMVDWMRDALIFGRQMAEHIRSFEAAALGHSASRLADGGSESPVKMSSVGKKLVRGLDMVLKDLVSWLRLTDVETLHQTFELIKTILGRVSKSNPDLSQDPDLEHSLNELDKFCRKPTKSYTSRLSDDLLSELSDLLTPFNLDLGDDEIQYVRTVEAAGRTSPSEAGPSRTSSPALPPSKPSQKNAFEEMMRSAKSDKAATSAAPTPARAGSSKAAPIDVDDFDDDFLDNFSAKDLDIIEKRAKMSTALPKGLAPPVRPPPAKPRPPPTEKLKINVVPRSHAPPPPRPRAAGPQSKFMKDLRKEMRQENIERRRVIGGVVPRLPAASGLGTGLGAYQPRPVQRVVKPVESSGSSASEDSDDDKGLGALIKKQKSPLKAARTVPALERRPIKVLGTAMADVIRQREDRRAQQLATKQRLKPDLSPLYRYVLGWDPGFTGPLAPHPPRHAAELSAPGPVPSTFATPEHYEKVMLPLFLQELWAQCQKEQTMVPLLTVEITGRNYEDDFLDMEIGLQAPFPPKYNLNETDMVILRQPGNPKHVFAKVQGIRRKFKDTAMKLRILNMYDQKALANRSKWQLQKHVSLSTAIREFAALRGLPFYEPALLLDILAGRSAPMPRLSDYAIDDAKEAYDVNEPQAKAILGAMDVTGFALIQGPPGTGKTKTISGLVGKWMSDRAGIIPLPGEKPVKAKLLVCAPSNAAIDEVCKRLMNGVPSSSGGRHLPVVVRIGVDQSVNDAVKDISLDNLVEARVTSEASAKDGGGGEYARIQKELEEVKAQIRDKQDELKRVQDNDEKRKAVENEYHSLSTRRTQLGQASSKAKDAARDATRHLEGARRAARDAILQEADIICATLSGAGQDSLAPYTFETVIIDEAAQAIEMSCLIPLKYGCKRCIMVGDPNQLPPTTFSSEAERFHYDESLFVRLNKQSSAHVQLLSIQYRMHPYISELPSKVFYDSQLKDGPDMAKKTAAVWHGRNIFGPYRFFNVAGTEVKAGTSTKNPDEARVAVDLYRRLEADFGTKVNLALRVGIITMYREQLYEMKRAFNQAFGESILQRIEFNTVDGFQGQEKDIIILSCVRSGPNLNSIGFLKDPRRMNVALTRAKSSLFVIGNGPTLERSDSKWRTIVGDARERGFFIDVSPTTFAAVPIETEIVGPQAKRKVKKERDSTSSTPASTPVFRAQADSSRSGEALPPKLLAAELKRRTSTDISGKEEKKRKLSESSKSDVRVKREVFSSSSDDEGPPKRTMAGAGLATTQKGPVPKPVNRGPGPSTGGARPIANGGPATMAPPGAPRPVPPKAPTQPSRAPRPAEDVLFIKKKKKPTRPPGAV